MLPRKVGNVKFTKKSNSVKLTWEQIFDSSEEKPSKYHIKFVDRQELDHLIEHTFGNTSPCLCEHTITGLQPGQTYTMIITVEGVGGSVDSDEYSLQTSGKSSSQSVCGVYYS